MRHNLLFWVEAGPPEILSLGDPPLQAAISTDPVPNPLDYNFLYILHSPGHLAPAVSSTADTQIKAGQVIWHHCEITIGIHCDFQISNVNIVTCFDSKVILVWEKMRTGEVYDGKVKNLQKAQFCKTCQRGAYWIGQTFVQAISILLLCFVAYVIAVGFSYQAIVSIWHWPDCLGPLSLIWFNLIPAWISNCPPL